MQDQVIIQDRILNLIAIGFNFGIMFNSGQDGRPKGVLSRVIKADTDGLLINSTKIIETQVFLNSVEFLDVITVQVDDINKAILQRNKQDIATCKHAMVNLGTENGNIKVCAFCRGNFGMAAIQTINLGIN